MDDRKWGFEDAEDWEYESSPVPKETDDTAADGIVGEDADRVVTVAVTRAAEVVSVTLSSNWRRQVDPRGLHSSVLAAMNNATMQALAVQVEEMERNPVVPTFPGTSPSSAASDDSPLTKEDVSRLMDAVTTELGAFTQQMSVVMDHPVNVESAGGHVGGSSLRGQVLEVSIDATWAATARSSEIESELVEMLRALHHAAVPEGLTTGPQGSAIAELNALASDPQRLLRRLGLVQ
jgi:DNA-binding protein YbaB